MGGSPSVSQPAVPTPTAPATPNNAASLAVEQATYRQQLRRKSIANTITPQGGAGGFTMPGPAPVGGGISSPAVPPVK